MNRTVAYWIPTLLVALAFGSSGALHFASPAPVVEMMGQIGFPEWFPRWLGAWKLAGVTVLLLPGLPRLKEWAYAGLVINASSAAAAHLAVGDAAGVVAPIVLLGLVLASWALRPEGRRLEGPRPEVGYDDLAVPAK